MVSDRMLNSENHFHFDIDYPILTSEHIWIYIILSFAWETILSKNSKQQALLTFTLGKTACSLSTPISHFAHQTLPISQNSHCPELSSSKSRTRPIQQLDVLCPTKPFIFLRRIFRVKKMVFVLTKPAIFLGGAVSSSLTWDLSMSLLCHCKELSSFDWLCGLLHHQREVVEPLIKVGVLLHVQTTQNNPGEGDEGLPHFFREIASSPFPTVQTISIVLEIHWKMNAMMNTKKTLKLSAKRLFHFQKKHLSFPLKIHRFFEQSYLLKPIRIGFQSVIGFLSPGLSTWPKKKSILLLWKKTKIVLNEYGRKHFSSH